MQGLIGRDLHAKILEYQKIFPVVAISGPRQCGKSTLAKMLLSGDDSYVYLDLERDSDLSKLHDPEMFFRVNRERNICIDEIQRKPELFRTMRPAIDERRRNGRFLILGSASVDLLKQNFESLAGRIGYLELSPFTINELTTSGHLEINRHWLRGGYPESYLHSSEEASSTWRENFLRTLIERDIALFDMNISSVTTRRLLSMCAHNQGQLLNSSRLGESMGISYHTVQKYLELLEQMYILRVLPPYSFNTRKRLVKSPKVYFRDSGVLHSLLGIGHINDLLGHPVYGTSWEGYCLENILTRYEDWQACFYRTSSGNEIDLILQKGKEKIAIEFKASSSPKPTKGMYYALDELGIETGIIIAQTKDSYPLNKRIQVSSLEDFLLINP